MNADKPKGQLSNRGIKPKEDRHQRIGDNTVIMLRPSSVSDKGRVAKDRRVKPKGEMTIPITGTETLKTAKGLWRRIAIQVSKHRFYNRTGASEQTAQLAPKVFQLQQP